MDVLSATRPTEVSRLDRVVIRRVRKQGMAIAQAHLRHLNPFPANLGDVLTAYDTVVVPEMNLGQLSMPLRSKYLVDVRSHTKVAGMAFKAEELQDVFTDIVTEPETAK